MYLKYHKIDNDSEIIELKIANESSAILDLTDKGDNQVTQHLREPLTFAYKKQKKNSSIYSFNCFGKKKKSFCEN